MFSSYRQAEIWQEFQPRQNVYVYYTCKKKIINNCKQKKMDSFSMFLHEFPLFVTFIIKGVVDFLDFYLSFTLELCSAQTLEFEIFLKQATVNTVVKLQVYYTILTVFNWGLLCSKPSSDSYLAEEVLAANISRTEELPGRLLTSSRRYRPEMPLNIPDCARQLP